MDLWNVLRSAVRYWYLTAVVLLVGLVLSTQWLSGIKPTYEASATVQFVGPQELNVTNPNPFLASGGSLTTTARAAEIAVGSPSTRGAVLAAGLEPGYLVEAELREPLVRVDVANEDPEITVATLNEVLERIEADLLNRQTALGVASAQHVRSQVLSADRVAAENDRGRSRARIALFGLVVLLAVFLAHGLDLVLGRLRASRKQPDDDLERSLSTILRDADETEDDAGSGTGGQEATRDASEVVKPGAPGELFKR